MKLKAVFGEVSGRMERIAPRIPAYAEALKAEGDYRDFETRLAWDCLRAVVPVAEICEWYDKYGCDDSHITTLAKACLRRFYKV